MWAVVGVGANLGAPVEAVKRALFELQLIGRDFRASPLYKTPPVSPFPQPDYVNAVCLFETDASITALFQELQAIERALGKVSKGKELPRPIDLDLLFYGARSYEEGEMRVPHPRWKERLFVLIPLSDLLGKVEVDGETFRMGELIAEFPKEEVEKIKVIHGESPR